MTASLARAARQQKVAFLHARVDPFVSHEPEVAVDAATSRLLKRRIN
jgi:hypothetical protein